MKGAARTSNVISFTRHFGNDLATLNTVFPGYTDAMTRHPSDFCFLDFLATGMRCTGKFVTRAN